MLTLRAQTLVGFNLILQKVYEMICEIIKSKTVGGIFLFFCQSRFINNFMEKNNFSESQNQQKLNISRNIHFKKMFGHRFEDLICTNKLDRYFFENHFFQRLGVFSTTEKPLIWAPFFPTKNYFYTFVQRWLFTFNILLKTCLRNLFRKTVKKCWFYFFK